MTFKEEVEEIFKYVVLGEGAIELSSSAKERSDKALTSLSRVLIEHLPKKLNQDYTVRDGQINRGYNSAITQVKELLGELTE